MGVRLAGSIHWSGFRRKIGTITGRLEMRPEEVGSLEPRPEEAGSFEMRPLDGVSSFEMRVAEEGSLEMCPEEVGSSLDPGQGGWLGAICGPVHRHGASADPRTARAALDPFASCGAAQAGPVGLVGARYEAHRPARTPLPSRTPDGRGRAHARIRRSPGASWRPRTPEWHRAMPRCRGPLASRRAVGASPTTIAPVLP